MLLLFLCVQAHCTINRAEHYRPIQNHTEIYILREIPIDDLVYFVFGQGLQANLIEAILSAFPTLRAVRRHCDDQLARPNALFRVAFFTIFG